MAWSAIPCGSFNTPAVPSTTPCGPKTVFLVAGPLVWDIPTVMITPPRPWPMTNRTSFTDQSFECCQVA